MGTYGNLIFILILRLTFVSIHEDFERLSHSPRVTQLDRGLTLCHLTPEPRLQTTAESLEKEASRGNNPCLRNDNSNNNNNNQYISDATGAGTVLGVVYLIPHSILTTTLKVGTVIISTLQMRKLRHKTIQVRSSDGVRNQVQAV